MGEASETCLRPAGFPASLLTAGSVLHWEESCAYTRADAPVCVFKLQTATRWLPFRSGIAYTDGTIGPQEGAPRKEACADPESGCGAWGSGNSGILGPWSGAWGVDSGVRECLAVQTEHPAGWVQQEERQGPLVGPRAAPGASALVLC